MLKAFVMRVSYWSCSRFAEWIRGEKKPPSLPWGEWEEWRSDLSARKPLRFFLAERGLNALQNFLMFPLDLWRKVTWKLKIRFFKKPYCLDTGLSKWHWHEFDDRIIHGLFNELKNFVEVELASGFLSTDMGEFAMKNGRCPKAGVAHLNWQMNLKYGDNDFLDKNDPRYGMLTPQAVAARRTLKLYRWWLERPSRPDPMDASGWSEVWESSDKNKLRVTSSRLHDIEEQYDREDEKMLIRLMKLRKSLWT